MKRLTGVRVLVVLALTPMPMVEWLAAMVVFLVAVAVAAASGTATVGVPQAEKVGLVQVAAAVRAAQRLMLFIRRSVVQVA